MTVTWKRLAYFEEIPAGIPAGGSSSQIVQWSSSGVGKWVTISGDATIADGGALTVAAVGGGLTHAQVLARGLGA